MTDSLVGLVGYTTRFSGLRFEPPTSKFLKAMEGCHAVSPHSVLLNHR